MDRGSRRAAVLHPRKVHSTLACRSSKSSCDFCEIQEMATLSDSDSKDNLQNERKQGLQSQLSSEKAGISALVGELITFSFSSPTCTTELRTGQIIRKNSKRSGLPRP